MLQEAGHQHPLQRHPGEAAALRRRQVGELRQAVEPPVDRRPVAGAQRQLVAARQDAFVAVERRLGLVAGDLELAAEARHQQLGVGGAERAERELAGLEVAAVEPGHEHAVEADRAGARARQHAKDVVPDRARVVLGEPADRVAHRRRGGAEIGAGIASPRGRAAAIRGRPRRGRPCRAARAGRARAAGRGSATASGHSCSPERAMSAGGCCRAGTRSARSAPAARR